MKSMITGALSRTRTTFLFFLFIVFFGIYSYLVIPKEANPDISFPNFYISIVHQGISPEDAERMLVRPIENELRGIEGIKEMKATASEGHASIRLEFYSDVELDSAIADVRDKVSLAKAKLPTDAEDPVVEQVTIASEDPALTVVLSGNVAERALVNLAQKLQDVLEGKQQILEVNISGDREDSVEIIVDPLIMESYGLDQSVIYNLVASNNRLVAAGNLDNGKGRFPVKVPSVYENVSDILSQPVKVDGDKVLTFADIAKVRRAYKDPNGFARLNGENAISLEVVKRPGENIIETVELVKAIMEEGSKHWPKEISVTYVGDKSIDVRQMLGDLQNNVISAVILVVIVIIAALGGRSATLVGISIPGAFLAGIMVIFIMGLTVNMVVLFSLIMSVGMLVDGSIVVTEFADRLMNEGMNRREAYATASRRMAWPITASTATTLAAFMPLIFWPGTTGQFMKYLPITLIATLSASLLMALVFVPVFGSFFGKPRALSKEQREQFVYADKGEYDKMRGISKHYVTVLQSALDNPSKVIAIAVLVSLGFVSLYMKLGHGVEFFPDVEPKTLTMKVRSNGDHSIFEQDEIVRKVEEQVLAIDGIETVYTSVGGRSQIGFFRIDLKEWDERENYQFIRNEIVKRVSKIPGIEFEVKKVNGGPGSAADVVIQMTSKNPDSLLIATEMVRSAINELDDGMNVSDTRPTPGLQWEIKVDRAMAARFGADVSLLGNSVQFVTNGLKIGEYRPDDADEELDILIRYPEQYRSVGMLSQLRIQTERGLVPVENFITKHASQKVESVSRIDGERYYQVLADFKPSITTIDKFLVNAKDKIAGLDLPSDVSVKFRGANEDQNESSSFLVSAFLVALCVMLMILVTQFNSFYQAFLILSAVLFSSVGVLIGLLVIQKPFGIVMSGVGIIALAGIIVNNNIVLIDTFNVLRRQGIPVKEAIVRTGAQRLRPVLLTTITTVLGLLPMVLEMNIDLIERDISMGAPSTQWWSQLAVAVAGGLTFATLLTLVLTPCMLIFGHNVSAFFSRGQSHS